MQMTFDVSTSVTLLFDFWDVHGAAGMLLSVLVVFLLAVLFEMMKVWRAWLGGSPPPTNLEPALDSSPSESSLTPIVIHPPDPTPERSSLQGHMVQTSLHVLQVAVGYLLMLCAMSYNTWIFLGVAFGSALGYFLSFPVLDRDGTLTGRRR